MAHPLEEVSEHTHKGGLHEHLGIPRDRTIPVGLIRSIAHAKVGERVRGHKVTETLKKEAELALTYAAHRPKGKLHGPRRKRHDGD